MIPSAFLERYRNFTLSFDCNNLKEKDVNFLIRDKKIVFKTQPFKHQVVCVYLGLLFPTGMLFFVDLGGGKTKIILDVLFNLKLDNRWNRCLVLSPNVSTISSWTDEIKKHSDFSYVELVGSSKEKWKNIYNDGDLVLLNYAGMIAMLSKTVNNRFIIDDDKIEEFLKQFDVVVFDEIHKCANPKSLTFKVCKLISQKCKFRFGMTGTPLNRSPLDLWSEFFIVDGGRTLGNNYFIFRNAYFKAKKMPWGTEWVFDKTYEKNLYTRIRNRSIRYTKNEMVDLPRITNIDLKVSASNELVNWYNEIFIDLFNKDKTNKTSFMLLRELCSGFIKHNGDFVEIETNKVDVLSDLLDDISIEDQIVIFLDFIKSGDIVAKLLNKKKISFERLYGETKDKVSVKEAFLSKKIRVLVANIKSGGTGLNLQTANYVIFYEPPISYREYIQACNRVHRPGQSKPVFIYNLITRDTIEEKIKKILNEGRDVFKALIDGEFSDLRVLKAEENDR